MLLYFNHSALLFNTEKKDHCLFALLFSPKVGSHMDTEIQADTRSVLLKYMVKAKMNKQAIFGFACLFLPLAVQ